MALYTFDPTTAPPSGNWPTQSNVSSNGTHWVLAGSVTANMDSGFSYALGGENELEMQAVINFPSTSVSYNGLSIAGNTTGSVAVILHWEAQNHYDVRIGSTYVYASAIAGGVDVTVTIIINKYNLSVLFNGACVYSGANPFGTSTTAKVTFQKYTEAGAGLVKSGYIDSRTVTNPPAPSARTTGFLSTIGMGK